jgi:hypothetical protein
VTDDEAFASAAIALVTTLIAEHKLVDAPVSKWTALVAAHLREGDGDIAAFLAQLEAEHRRGLGIRERYLANLARRLRAGQACDYTPDPSTPVLRIK